MADLIQCREIAALSECREQVAGAIACIGVFDGLHRGHAFLIEKTCSHADSAHAKSLVVTFDKDPDELFHPETLRKLSDNDARIDALLSMPVDAVLVLPFTADFAALPPEVFLGFCLEPLGLAGLHVGSDFRFGARALGTIETLKEWGSAQGVNIVAHDLLDADGQPITSTRIRAALAAGDIEQANELLGHPYSVFGTVLRGRGDGSKMGISTANLVVPESRLAIAEGVYGARAFIGDATYKAAVSVGVSPTFESTSIANIEAHILDFEGDLYGETIAIAFLAWLRPMILFKSTEELVSTIQSNIEWVRQHC